MGVLALGVMARVYLNFISLSWTSSSSSCWCRSSISSLSLVSLDPMPVEQTARSPVEGLLPEQSPTSALQGAYFSPPLWTMWRTDQGGYEPQ